MKNIFLLLWFVSITACAQNKEQTLKQDIKQKTMTQNTQTNPEQVIMSLIEAMKNNDAKKIKSLFHDNASQAYGDGAAKFGAAFFKWLDSDIIDRKGHVENAQFSVDGNNVVVTGQYSSEGYTNKANFLFSVKDGEIISWQMRY